MSTPNVPAELATRAKQLVVGTIIKLFVLDASRIMSKITGLAGPIYYFHNGNEQGFITLHFQGHDFIGLPIKVDGFEYTTGAKTPRPVLTIGNLSALGLIGGSISALLKYYNNFNEAILYRKQTLFEYLDDQSSPNPAMEYPVEKWRVDTKTLEKRDLVSFECAAPFDLANVKIPRGQLLANACQRVYRSPIGCAYGGNAKTDAFGNTLTVLVDRGAWNSLVSNYIAGDQVYTLVNGIREVYVAVASVPLGHHPRYFPAEWKKDVCLKRVSDCDLRFTPNPLHTSAWPAIIRAATA